MLFGRTTTLILAHARATASAAGYHARNYTYARPVRPVCQSSGY